MLFKEITVEEFAEIRAREAAKDAYDEGEKSGFSKGEKSGFSKGEQSGIKLGAAQKEREIAKQMLKESMTKVTIRKKTRQQKQAKRKALKNHSPETEIDQDDIFFFIAGYTAGGVPYGVTWEEMGLKPWQKYEEEECEDAFL